MKQKIFFASLSLSDFVYQTEKVHLKGNTYTLHEIFSFWGCLRIQKTSGKILTFPSFLRMSHVSNSLDYRDILIRFITKSTTIKQLFLPHYILLYLPQVSRLFCMANRNKIIKKLWKHFECLCSTTHCSL